jgi:hypothetical protein
MTSVEVEILKGTQARNIMLFLTRYWIEHPLHQSLQAARVGFLKLAAGETYR